MPTSTGKDWKIILLIMRIYKSGKKLTKPTTPMHPNGTSLEHSSGSSLKFSQRAHLQLLSTALELGYFTNAFYSSIYMQSLQYECMKKKIWPFSILMALV